MGVAGAIHGLQAVDTRRHLGANPRSPISLALWKTGVYVTGNSISELESVGTERSPNRPSEAAWPPSERDSLQAGSR